MVYYQVQKELTVLRFSLITLRMQMKNWELNRYHFLISHDTGQNPNVEEKKWNSL